jgi:TPP-dependent pyruvate/acetoin dehydrogenase alpha subunit
VDGNHVVAVYGAVRRAVERARRGEGPSIVEADTMRMRGHAEHDDMKYVPPALLEEWRKKDPLLRFEEHLLKNGALAQSDLDGMNAGIERYLQLELEAAEQSPLPAPDSGLSGVYGDRETAPPVPPLVAEWERTQGTR